MKSHKNDGNKSSVVNFGLHGWVTIFYCLLMFWLYAGMVNSGANVTAPAIAEKFGILSGTVLTTNTVAGVVGVIFFIIVGQVNRAIGARITSGVCMILAGIAYWGVGNAVNLAMYTICMCVVVGGVMSAGYISGGDLVTQWFPKKKGIVMGYTTMGHNLASVAFVPLITYLVGTMGIGNGVLPISVCCIVLGVLGLLIVRNTPQERGLNPDNVSDEVYQNEYYHGPQDNTGGNLRYTYIIFAGVSIVSSLCWSSTSTASTGTGSRARALPVPDPSYSPHLVRTDGPFPQKGPPQAVAPAAGRFCLMSCKIIPHPAGDRVPPGCPG